MGTASGFLLTLLYQTVTIVSLPGPVPQSAQLGSDAVISCKFPVTSLPTNPRFLSIQWSFKNKLILKFDGTLKPSEPRWWLDTGQIDEGNASLVIRKVRIDDDGLYLCTVAYDGHLHEQKFKLSIRACPDLMVIKNTVVKGRKSIVGCLAIGFHPIDIQFEWFINDVEVEDFSTYKPLRTSNRTYRVNSTLELVPTNEDTNKVFSCRIHHVSLTEPIQKDFTLVYGEMPSVSVTPSKLFLGKEQALVCRAWGFYPEDISLNWFLNDSRLETTEYCRINSSAVELMYTFTPKLEHQGMVLHCRVRHSTLVESITESVPIMLDAFTAGYRYHFEAIPAFLVFLVMVVLLCKKNKHACLVHVTHIPVPPIVAKKEACLKCTVLCCHPKTLAVKWLIREREVLREISPLDEHYMIEMDPLPSGNTNACTLSLIFTPSVEHHDGTEIICRVSHPSLSQPEERSSGTIWVKSYPKVSEIIINHHTFEVAVDCIKAGSMQVNWQLVSLDDRSLCNWLDENIICIEKKDGTFRSTSTYKLPVEYIKMKQHYIMKAQIEHEVLKEPVERSREFEIAPEDPENSFVNRTSLEVSQMERSRQAAANVPMATRTQRPCSSCDSVAIEEEVAAPQIQEAEDSLLCEAPSHGTDWGYSYRKLKENSGENMDHNPSHEETKPTCRNTNPAGILYKII